MFRYILISVLWLSLIFPSVVFAQTYSIKEMTPQVESALESRRDRYDQLGQLKAAGVIGENNRGYVEVLKSDAQAESIATAENANREVIYQTIAEQNGLSEEIATIEKVFAQVQHEKADPKKNGEW